MPGFLVQVGAQVKCMHAGTASATKPNPRVTLGGKPSIQTTSPMAIAGCTMPPPNAGNGPCVTGKWTLGTQRVKSDGQSLVLQTSTSTCTPTGTALVVAGPQSRVTAT